MVPHNLHIVEILYLLTNTSAWRQLYGIKPRLFVFLALEPRIMSRWDCHSYARDAYNLGVRYIGGCCGFEPYHIRAVAEELSEERGKLPKGSEKHDKWGAGLKMHTKPWVRAR